MIHTTKNIKWVIATAVICILLGLLTFFTFINRSFIELNEFNLQVLLFIDLILLVVFFSLILSSTYKILKDRKKGKLGSKPSLRYIFFYTATTLLPSILIAIFSLVLFNLSIQQYFNKKVKSAVNNSAEVARYYVEELRNSVEADILLMLIDINSKSGMFYDNPRQFLNVVATQRLLRRLDEVYLLDGSGNIIMSSVADDSFKFIPPNDEAYIKSLEGKPVRITDPISNRTSALVKLSNFIDTYLYIVKFMEPKVMDYLL